VTAVGDCVLNGDIRANGADGQYAGGAGGSIYLRVRTISGSGTLSADGGAPLDGGSNHGTGGGGRIAVILAAGDSFDAVSMHAFGGSPGSLGAAGTVYRQTQTGDAIVTIDNSNRVSSVYTTIPAQYQPNATELEDATVVVTNKAVLSISTNGFANALIVASTSETVNLGDAGDRLTVNAMTINGTAYTRAGAYTVANDWQSFGLPANVSGDGELFLYVPPGTLISFR